MLPDETRVREAYAIMSKYVSDDDVADFSNYGGLNPHPSKVAYSAKRLKRCSLGWFATDAIKSLDQLALDLENAGIVRNKVEGKQAIPKLEGIAFQYGRSSKILITKDHHLMKGVHYKISVVK